MTSSRMPTLFLGHGNPMNAIRTSSYAAAWKAIGSAIAKPKAIVCVSAHWYVPAAAVTAMPSPRTIHDFGRFPQELFEVQYPAPGDSEMAARIQSLLAPTAVTLDQEWGLDHGTWSVLCHVFPEADIPVVQLSIDQTQPPAWHFDLGQQLRALRDEGVLILGSGNVVHNLRSYDWNDGGATHYDWADRFERRVEELLAERDFAPLIDYETLGEDASLSIPTPEHYLPLLYVMGASDPAETPIFPVRGMDGGSISMLAVQFG